MPLSIDEAVNNVASTLVSTLRSAFQTPACHGPAHAKGRLLRGSFVPSPRAAELSCAPHFSTPSIPILARFSSSTGLKNIPDTNANANPRGLAVRILLSEDEHRYTDVIAHSTKYFPMRTGEGFLAMLAAIGNGSIGEVLDQHPSAKAFVSDPKPSPVSFGTEVSYGVNAFKLVDSSGERGEFVRYRFVPALGLQTLSPEELETKGADYLFEDLPSRLPMAFKFVAQIAREGDVSDDATVLWPEEKEIVELGTITLTELEDLKTSLEEEKKVVFDPIPRIKGVEASADPLLEMRAAVYLISGRGRREA